MCGTCTTQGEMRIAYTILDGKLQGKRNLGELCVYEIKLKYTLPK